jgi:hypothetical protein
VAVSDLGGDLSRFQNSTPSPYLCRRREYIKVQGKKVKVKKVKRKDTDGLCQKNLDSDILYT